MVCRPFSNKWEKEELVRKQQMRYHLQIEKPLDAVCNTTGFLGFTWICGIAYYGCSGSELQKCTSVNEWETDWHFLDIFRHFQTFRYFQSLIFSDILILSDISDSYLHLWHFVVAWQSKLKMGKLGQSDILFWLSGKTESVFLGIYNWYSLKEGAVLSTLPVICVIWK